MNLQWKEVVGSPEFMVSNTGLVKRIANGRVMHGHRDEKGYIKIVLRSRDGSSKLIRIHRLVATAFIPNPENKPQVNHLDSNKSNNAADNLEWATNAENQLHYNAMKRSGALHKAA